MPGRQDRNVAPFVALRRADVADAAVAVVVVVPMHERTRPFTGNVEICEA